MPGRGPILLYVNPVEAIGIAFQSEAVKSATAVIPFPACAVPLPSLIQIVSASMITVITLFDVEPSLIVVPIAVSSKP